MSLLVLQEKIGAPVDGVFSQVTLRLAAKHFRLTPLHAVHFFTQVASQTNNFTQFVEHLNLSAQELADTWPNKFARDMRVTPRLANLLAEDLAHKPQEIANTVYSNTMGNGDYTTNDGWKFRGRGAILLLGKNNYQAFADHLGKPEIVDTPDVVATEFAFESALHFFDKNKLWTICDRGTSREVVTDVTKRINPGLKGLPDVLTRVDQYKRWLLTAPR